MNLEKGISIGSTFSDAAHPSKCAQFFRTVAMSRNVT